MIDPETGTNRTVFFREALREKFRLAFDQRRQALEHLFLKFDSPPLFVESEYSPETVSHYFEQYMNL